MLQVLRNHKGKSADIKFVFIVKFTRSLPLKVIKNMNQIRSLAKKRFFSCFFKSMLLLHEAKTKVSALAKLNVEFFTVKFSQKLK